MLDVEVEVEVEIDIDVDNEFTTPLLSAYFVYLTGSPV